jgi:hypothetical protein
LENWTNIGHVFTNWESNKASIIWVM